jgi:hypothetical protein
MDNGVFTGCADLQYMRELHPQMQTFRSWLHGSGREAFDQALGTAGAWEYGHG